MNEIDNSTVGVLVPPQKLEPDWITCKEARETTGRGKTSIKNWMDSGELPTRMSEDGVTLVCKEILLQLDASRRKSQSTKGLGGSEPAELPPAQSSEEDEDQQVVAPADGGPDSDTSQVPVEAASLEAAFTDTAPTLDTRLGVPAPEEKIAISAISFDEETQIRERVHEDVVNDYSEQMKRGEKFPPVILFREGIAVFIGDGWHRLLSAKKNGYTHFPAQVYGGGKAAAVRYALKANITHGLRLTSADKRKKVGVALSEYPTLSSNEIANVCGVSEALVRSIRDTFVKNEPAKRIGADGKEYPARKKAKDDGKKEKVLFKKTAKLAQKLTLEDLLRLKDIIEARIKSF